MKAEHRHELQTNSLADFIGRTVTSVRTGKGISWFWVLAVVIVLAGVLIFFFVRNARARANSEAWAKIEFNDYRTLTDLVQNSKETKQGQAARFTLGYGFLWDGIRYLGAGDASTVREAVGVIAQSVRVFGELAEELKDDNERLAEAKYHMAVANEALAAFMDQFLEEAKKGFDELSKGDLANTGYGQLAKKRMEQYNDTTEYKKIVDFYKEFRERTQGPAISAK